MAESYKKIYPGNAVAHLNAYASPNDDFSANGRASGDPRDRKQQALMFCPGWLAVRKVGVAHITAGATSWDFKILSPDLRPDDKPRADITGLFIPSGSVVIRAGFRVPAVNAQPGYYSSGSRQEADDLGSGLVGTATDLLAISTAAISASATGSIAAGAVRTASDGTAKIVVDAAGQVPTGFELVQTAFGSPVVTNTDLTLKLYSIATAGNTAGSAISSALTGGCYVVGEVVYLVPEGVAGMDSVSLPGAQYSGYAG
jgi:hypothetical protein